MMWWIIGGAVALWALTSMGASFSAVEQAKIDQLKQLAQQRGEQVQSVQKKAGGIEVVVVQRDGNRQPFMFLNLDDAVQSMR